MNTEQTKTITLVLPVFNEEDNVTPFVETVIPILQTLDMNWEMVFVDDGSTDTTTEVVQQHHQKHHNIKLLCLSRNFGKEAALTAGLEWAQGDAVVPMDVDLQDPPELLIPFVEKWQQGFDVVLGQRSERKHDTKTKKWSAGLFYKIFNKISSFEIEPNVGDYRLMDRKVVTETLKLRERNRFMKGLFSWVGFKTALVTYERPARQIGHSKFNFWKLWNFALDGITGFSTIPLRIWTYIGVALSMMSFLYLIGTGISVGLMGNEAGENSTLLNVILFLGGVQLMSLGIMGEYLGRLYMEVKQRPIYVVSNTIGLDPR